MKRVFVLGSVNMDYTVTVKGFPHIGESKVGYGFTSNQGGKGANQAVACAKLGCTVSLIACVGDDDAGRRLVDSIAGYGVDVSAVAVTDKAASGACMIFFDDLLKDNMLVVDRGANEHISPSYVERYLKDNATPGDVFITQLEVNPDAVYAGLAAARKIGMYTILNPAPVVRFDVSCLKNVDLIVPNEVETKLLTGISVSDGCERVYDYFRQLGVGEVIVTLGGKGSVYMGRTGIEKCAPYQVEVVDTTSAGDTFIGAIAMQKARGKRISEALDFASKCSAITVSRKGAAVSIPTEAEVKESMIGR